ncbi:hypothetical protein JQ611_01655 [Bradyrhizobium sp. AUGA SZCCT0182]|nr:hypothetical protein [Bradyrhizobium sp. AUGA SZCCT0182]
MSATTIRPATMKGSAIFPAQFIGDDQPFDSFDAICGWAAGLGYKGVQVPTSDPRLIDLDKAAASEHASRLAVQTVPRPRVTPTPFRGDALKAPS